MTKRSGKARSSRNWILLSSVTQAALGWCLYFARRYEEAVLHLDRAVELEPRSVVANSRLGIVYAQMRRYDEAIAAFERIRELAPKAGDFIRAEIAHVYALMDKRAKHARWSAE